MVESHVLELLALLLLLSTSLSAAPGPGPGVLDSTIRDCAFKELRHRRRRSGVPYEVPLPADLSGVTSSAARTGSRTLWAGGASLAAFRIPPRAALPAPFVRRLALVYENLGSYRHSPAYYSVPGYSLVAPVVGLLAYDASDAATEVDLDVTGRDPILIAFQGLVVLQQQQHYYCARFARDGSVRIGGTVASNCTCSTRSTGHFTVVVPNNGGGGGGRWWWRWVASGCGGAVGLALLGLVGARMFRWFRDGRVRGAEVEAEEGEALDWVWVGKSRMPSAAAARTKPVLETSSTP